MMMKIFVFAIALGVVAAESSTLAPVLNYDVVIDLPTQNGGVPLNGTLTLQAQGRLVDLPVSLIPGQQFKSQIAVSAFQPAEIVQIRWFSLAPQPILLSINNFVISSARGVRTFCGHKIPQDLAHNIFVEFGISFCSH